MHNVRKIEPTISHTYCGKTCYAKKVVCPLFICFCRRGLDVMTTQCRQKKNIMKEMNHKQLEVLREMSSWCLQDLGSKSNRTKVSTIWKEDLYVHRERTRGPP